MRDECEKENVNGRKQDETGMSRSKEVWVICLEPKWKSLEGGEELGRRRDLMETSGLGNFEAVIEVPSVGHVDCHTVPPVSWFCKGSKTKVGQ